MKRTIALSALAFAVTFAVVVTSRLSDQALAVVAGVICGIAIGLPVNIGVLLALRQNCGQSVDSNTGQPYETANRPMSARQPPIYVLGQLPNVQGYAPPPAPYYGASLPASEPLYRPREFKIVGEE